MVLHGGRYPNPVSEEDEPRPNRLANIRQKVVQSLRTAFNHAKTKYNLRSRDRIHAVGAVVWFRNLKLSKAGERYSSKLAPRFVKGVVMTRLGSHTYRVKDEAGRIHVLHTSFLKT